MAEQRKKQKKNGNLEKKIEKLDEREHWNTGRRGKVKGYVVRFEMKDELRLENTR